MKLDPLHDGKSSLELLDWMGSDLSVVNDARQSYGRESLSFDERDRKLLSFLLEEEHTSPLRGVVFKMRVRAPLFIARQWWKHVIGCAYASDQLGWNEQSFRYAPLQDSTDYYTPAKFRLQSTQNKQQSSGECLTGLAAQTAWNSYKGVCDHAARIYLDLVESGVSRELARAVLPPAFYTQFVWTFSLQAALHFIDLRIGKGAQSEIVAYANGIETLIAPIVKETIEAWRAANDKQD